MSKLNVDLTDYIQRNDSGEMEWINPNDFVLTAHNTRLLLDSHYTRAFAAARLLGDTLIALLNEIEADPAPYKRIKVKVAPGQAVCDEDTAETIRQLDDQLAGSIPDEVKQHLYAYRDLLKAKAPSDAEALSEEDVNVRARSARIIYWSAIGRRDRAHQRPSAESLEGWRKVVQHLRLWGRNEFTADAGNVKTTLDLFYDKPISSDLAAERDRWFENPGTATEETKAAVLAWLLEGVDEHLAKKSRPERGLEHDTTYGGCREYHDRTANRKIKDNPQA